MSNSEIFIFDILGANPVWNPEEEDGPKVKNRINPLYKNDQDDDTDSDSSGDNVIIGVEDQDDFKDYQDRYDVNTPPPKINNTPFSKVLHKYACYFQSCGRGKGRADKIVSWGRF